MTKPNDAAPAEPRVCSRCGWEEQIDDRETYCMPVSVPHDYPPLTGVHNDAPAALPDVEVWYASDEPLVYIGWYWRLKPAKFRRQIGPDHGPFPTETAARQDAERRRG